MWKTIFAVILLLIVTPTTILGIISLWPVPEDHYGKCQALSQSNTSQVASNIGGIMKNLQNSSLSFYQNEMVITGILASSTDRAMFGLPITNKSFHHGLCFI